MFKEYLKPWKLITFAIGTAILIWGSYATPAPDWDIPVSLLMATATYLAHPYAFRRKNADDVLFAVYLAWICVDGLYSIYWSSKNPLVLEMMRSANWPASLWLYVVANLIWNYGEQVVAAIRAIYCEYLALFPLQHQSDPDLIERMKDSSANDCQTKIEAPFLQADKGEQQRHKTPPEGDYPHPLLLRRLDAHNQRAILGRLDQDSSPASRKVQREASPPTDRS